MSAQDPAPRAQPFEPRWPTLSALALLSLWVAILSLPMLSGDFVAAPYNDQYATGYAFREWAANQWRALGHVPLWNPEILGGLPFVAGMHGDVFYPTAFLRLILPTHVAMNLGFVIHYVLAGLFTYWFVRLLGASWGASVVGGVVYQLSGVIGSYVSPGHDGKLFVTAMLPLSCIALTLAIRDRKLEGYAILALSVGLALLSPHPQMAQYALLAAGLYAIYLVVEHTRGAPLLSRVTPLVLALVAVGVGVLVAAIQYFPFYGYIPYSPRDEAVVASFAWSATYAIPWEHTPEFLLSRFAGESFNGTYWATNGVKFHSEYLGLSAVALAVLGLLDRTKRPLAFWLAGIGLLFLLVALGDETPFFRLWWSVVPFVKSTRAPGMALFVTAFAVAVLAGLGAHRLLAGDESRMTRAWLLVGAVVALMGASGIVGMVAESLAGSVQAATGRPSLEAVAAGREAIRLGALVSGLGLLGVGVVSWAVQRQRITAVAASLLLFTVVGGDLWSNARAFWNYSRAQEEVFGPDQIKAYLARQPRPFRVWNVGFSLGVRPAYPQSSLMADEIAQWFGHHGNELHAFDLVTGREGIDLVYTREGHPRLLELFAINSLIIPAEVVPESIPGFTPVLQAVQTSTGRIASLFERRDPIPYARLVPAAAKVERDRAIATVLDPRLDLNRVVLVDPDARIEVGSVETLPEPLSDVVVRVTSWRPGSMAVEIGGGGAPAPAYLVMSENYYKDWRARADGAPAPVVLGNGALIAVQVPAGTQRVELEFESTEFRVGKTMTIVSLLLIACGLVVPPVVRRRQGA